MLEYSEQGKRLVSTFLAYRNDVDIYTEDEEKNKEFYKVLFSRLLDPNIRINDITPLGCKKNVIDRCKNEPISNRKKVFIVDGDLSILTGEVLQLENLYVLEKYCIENFLIDKGSTCNFVYLNCGTKSKDVIIEDLDYDAWLGKYSNSLIELFIHFGIMNSLGGKFTLFNAQKYHKTTKASTSFEEHKVNEDIAILKNEIIHKFGEEPYDKKHKEFSEKWSKNLENLLTLVSGKDYLIPILLIETQKFKSSKSLPSLDEVKINLVQTFDVAKLKNLKTFIET